MAQVQGQPEGKSWLKYKVNRGQEFVIGRYTARSPFDALIVGYYEDERLLYAAKVRNGFVPLVRREVASKFQRPRDRHLPVCQSVCRRKSEPSGL